MSIELPKITLPLSAIFAKASYYDEALNLRQIIHAAEHQRLYLLQNMHNIDISKYESLENIDQLFDILRPENPYVLDCLQIAKLYLCLSRISSLCQDFLEENISSRSIELTPITVLGIKDNLIRWILIEALQQNPSLFGVYAKDLDQYLRSISYITSFIHQTPFGRKDEINLQILRQGEVLKPLQRSAIDAITRLNKQQPLVFSLQPVGLGDTLLALPAICNVADTFEQLGLKNPIRIVVPQKLGALIQFVLNKYKYIEVYSLDIENMEMYIEIVKKLAYREFDSTEQDENRQGGIIVSLIVDIGQNEKKIDGNQPILSFMVNFLPLSSLNYEELQPAFFTTYKSAMQISLSYQLGIKMYHEEDHCQLAQTLEVYLKQYTKKSCFWQEHINKLKESKGFEQGYICLIEQGSIQTKWVITSLFTFLLTQLQKFCQIYQIGIVLIKNSDQELDTSIKKADIAREKGIAYEEITIQDDIAYTLAFLQHAQGVIGPDTFLLHAAEYFPDLPLLGLYSNSHVGIFRLNKSTYQVSHMLANGALWDAYFVSYNESHFYSQEILHPFTILNYEEKSNYHPLIQTVQDAFRQRLQEALSHFCTQISQRYQVLKTLMTRETLSN